MKRSIFLGLTLTAALLSAASLAQDNQRYDQIDLNASASRDVENDLLIATVFAEVEDSDQSDAANEVNENISWAAARARDVAGIEVQTMNYSTRPVYANGRRIVGWIARQELRLESQDAEALSALLGELQQRVAIQQINYALSTAAREEAEETLIAEALAQFNRRADLVAEELDRTGFKIVRLSIGTSGARPFVQQRSLQAQSADGFFAPEIEAGDQTLSVSVNGTVELEAER